MTRQTAVRLSDETYERLRALAARTGRTATYYVREAVEAHLDDLEDFHMAELALARLRRGQGRRWSLDEAERELGLDD